jgi:hypothetical protein
VAVDRSIQITPTSSDLDIGFVDVPAFADPPFASPPKVVDQDGVSFASQSRTAS